MTDLIAIGEILIDLTQTGMDETGAPLFAAYPGGAPANVAVAAARLGSRTAFIGAVGADPFGGYLRRVLEENRVDVSGLRTGNAPTTLAIVSVDGGGERSFQFIRGADSSLSAGEVDGEAVRRSRVLHFGSVSLTRDPARQAVLSTVQCARQAGVLVSYDPNYRAALWSSEAEAREWMARPLPLVDLIKLSEEELPLLTGSNDLTEGSGRLARQGISLVLVTLGSAGVFCRWSGTCFTVPGVPTRVADTNGAGDTFLGAVLHRLCVRGPRPLEGLEWKELEQVLSYANRAAALTCSRSGAIPAMPTREELEETDVE